MLSCSPQPEVRYELYDAKSGNFVSINSIKDIYGSSNNAGKKSNITKKNKIQKDQKAFSSSTLKQLIKKAAYELVMSDGYARSYYVIDIVKKIDSELNKLELNNIENKTKEKYDVFFKNLSEIEFNDKERYYFVFYFESLDCAFCIDCNLKNDLIKRYAKDILHENWDKCY